MKTIPSPAVPLSRVVPRLTAVLLAAVLAGACDRQPARQPPRLPKVTVAQPHFMTVTNWDLYPAHLQAVEAVDVRARVSGSVVSIHFTDGADVRAGDLLFVIDPRPFEADLLRAQADCRRAEAQADFARSDLRRAETLHLARAVTDEEFDSRTQAARAAEAALAAARAAETVARLNLAYTRVEAPITGRIGRRLITVGNLVQGGTAATLLATIVSTDPIHAYFDAEEGAFRRYRMAGDRGNGLGQPGVQVPCEITPTAPGDAAAAGLIDFYNNQVDPRSGTIRLRAVFANPGGTFMPGAFVTVRVPAGPPARALLIPEAAVCSDQAHKFVYLVNTAGQAEPRPVTLGRRHGADVTVLAGLAETNTVVVNGLMMVRPGAPVEVQTP
jgi:RND family efflux transporter MFP subunit